MANPCRADIDAAQFQTELQTIASYPTRIIGTAGYDATGKYLTQQFAALGSAVQYKAQPFSVMVPTTASATLDIASDPAHPVRIYPFWPAEVRVNSTPTQGITGKLVYVGNADYASIHPPGGDWIAVVEATAGQNWPQAAYFGAKAILVLGAPDTNYMDLRYHELPVPVDIPRFYVKPGPQADALRFATLKGPATIHAAVNWVSKTAVNYYVLVSAPKQIPDGWTGSTPPGALLISVPYDSSSLVPDLAPGASQAVQTAAGLSLLRDLAKHPLNRPVLMFFSGADSIQFLGQRNMLMALAQSPAFWQQELDASQKTLSDDRAMLQRLREILPDPASSNVENPGDRDALDRVAKIVETEYSLKQDELFTVRRTSITPNSDTAKTIQQDTAYLATLNELSFELQTNRTADRTTALRSKQMLPIARDFIQRGIESLAGGTVHSEYGPGLIAQVEDRQKLLQDRIDLYHWLAGKLGLNPDPPIAAQNMRLIELEVGIDLSDSGARMGLMYQGDFAQSSDISMIQDYKDWFTRLEQSARDADNGSASQPTDKWFDAIRPIVDFDALSGGRAPQSWLAASMPIPSEMAPAWGVPSFSVITFDDLRRFRDTPADTLANLKVPPILKQLTATRELLFHAWNDPSFRGGDEWISNNNQFSGQVVSFAEGRPVPDLPRPGFLVTYYYGSGNDIPGLTPELYTLGIRRTEVHACDADGNYYFEGMPRLGWGGGGIDKLFVQAYTVAKNTGEITWCSDLGDLAASISEYVDLTQTSITPLHSIVFKCSEFSLVGLYDPRYLQDLGQVVPLDAVRDSTPQRYDCLLANRMMAGFFEPDSRLFLLFRYGQVGNRLVLLNMQSSAGTRVGAEHAVDAAAGFTLPQLQDIRPLALVTSADFWRLNEIRLTDYAKAGVSNTLIDSMQLDSKQALARAETALQHGQGDRMIAEATSSWANQARVYSATSDMADDVIHAAIFLLLLCVPFSFCMERLLIGSPNIYRQISGMCAIFAIMTALLWSFHPAFKISSSPLIIILAFAIIFMSIVVISVVYGKFDTELKRIRSGRGQIDGTSFARASVLMSAVLLGIANMRRRKFRTALTSITIVLITFAVLCFTSASRYLGSTRLPTGIPTQFPGLMIRQRGFRPMLPMAAENIRAVLPTLLPAKQADRPDAVVERWWCVGSDPDQQYDVTATGTPHDVSAAGEPLPPPEDQVVVKGRPRVFAVEAILGLSPGEQRLATPAHPNPLVQILGAKAYQRLDSGERNIIYMSQSVAEQLRVRVGDHVQIGGIDLQVASIFNGDDFDQQVTMLSGEPITPIDYKSSTLDAGGRSLSDQSVAALALDSDSTASELSNAYQHLSAGQIVIVPSALARILPDATLRSIAVPLDNEKQVQDVSDDLARRLSVAIFAGHDDGVKLVSAGDLQSVSGGGQVAIPLAIAGLIVFNTMMGSIAERRREIHVYTSLGLAPLHVGALFVAEALTYGLIGTVFGYIVGQLAGTVLLKLGWLGNVTLNYSGTSAMLTMGLILTIVLLSALVPARLASKIAAPSIERNWRVPLPKDGQILAQLPFTINRTAAEGALAYLADFFDAHQEGSIGKFSAGPVEPFDFEDEEGRKSRGLKSIIWLTPFDLGVRQHLMLLIHPGQYPDIYEVQVILQRLSGDDRSWHRMNRTFLTELRKQFLQWRSLSPQRMMQFVEDSRKLFGNSDAAAMPAVAAGTEELRLT
ncbi:MAG TPA: FtsX-like permease family protein [Tepidisphaeraceae bacterium]|nr:FtsX-like permease family protein [Tepidisphaeraceae bacterium]